MPVNMGNASGTLTLDASGFFSSIKSAASSLNGFNGDLDRTKQKIKETETQTKTTGTKFEGFGTKIKSVASKFKSALRDIEKFGTKVKDLGKKLDNTGKNMSLYLTTPITALGTASVKTASTFESAMSQVQATMGASKEDMTDLEKAAKSMGSTTQYTATEAAQALNYLAQTE